MKSFLTGSHVYGRPNSRSDVDLVVQVDLETALKLRELCDNPGGALDADRVHPTIVRFGKLNLILCETDEQMTAWKAGTVRMMLDKSGRPFSKEQALKVFTKLRELMGIEDNYVGGE